MRTLHCRPADGAPSEVRIGAGLLAELPALAADRPTFALLDERVAARHPHLRRAGWTALELPGGEACKSFATAERVLRALAQAGIDRGGRLIAVGGGSIGDLGGFCASLWLRGIALWQVPTTFLAMTDAAVGGKTALDLPEGKNLVGTVWPAERVLVDPTLAADLPEGDFRSGLAEAVKMAIGLDAALFARLEAELPRVLARDLDLLTDVVARSLAAKIAVVEGDLRETGRRRLLNLGHTLGHALEAWAEGRQPHGLCVARGLHFALDLARELGALTAPDHARAGALLRACGYEPWPLPPVAALQPFLARDKKVAAGVVHFALPTGIGCSEVRPLPLPELLARLR